MDGETAALVLPSAEHGRPPVRLVAAAVDEAGWYRPSAVLVQGESGCAGRLDLVPADATGEVELEAIAVRTADVGAGTDERFASRAGMRVASSAAVRVLTREPARVPGGALDVRWEDFGTSQHPERKRRSDRIFHLETTSEPPILWLNRANPDLVAVLESRGTRGPKAMVRDLVDQAIAMPVWYALVHAASLSVTRDEDGTATVREGWRRGLLARIAPRLHPGIGREVAYQRLLDELLEHDEVDVPGREWLAERMVSAVADEVDFPVIVGRALRELSRR